MCSKNRNNNFKNKSNPKKTIINYKSLQKYNNQNLTINYISY